MKPFLPASAFIRKKQKPFSPNKKPPSGLSLQRTLRRCIYETAGAEEAPVRKLAHQVLVDGKRVGRTFPTKEEAEYWAAGLKTKIMEENRSPWKMTVGAAVDRYIESKSSILSPSTVLGYKRTKKRMEDIIGVQLNDLTQEKIQRWVNQLANDHGLLSAVLKEYRPSMTLRTTLPSKVKAEIQIPSEAEIRAILKECRGTKYELPIMLAVWLGLRQSEILGLEWRDIDGDTLKIRRAIVLGEDGPTQKGTKTYSETAPYPGLHPGTAGPAAPQRRPHCQHDREIYLLRVLPHL